MSRAEQGGRHLVPLAMLLAGACSYAMTFSLNRIAITEGIPVFPFVFWQGVGAGTVCAGRWPCPRAAADLEAQVYLRFYFIFGFIGIALPYTMLALAAPRVPAGAVALTLTLSPILTYAFATLFRLDRVGLLRVAGILLGPRGHPGGAGAGRRACPNADMAPWLLLAFGSPVCYAFGSVTVVFLRPAGSQPIPLTCGIAFASAILLLPVMAVGRQLVALRRHHDRRRLVADRRRRAHGLLLRHRPRGHPHGRAGLSSRPTATSARWPAWAGPRSFSREVPSPWIGLAVALLFAGLFLVNRTSRPVIRAEPGP